MSDDTRGAAADELHFRVLGSITVEQRGQHLDLGGAQRRRLVAALLLAANHARSTSDLVDAVWGAHPPTSARGALHTHVARVRQILATGPSTDRLLQTAPNGYALVVANHCVDVRRFDSSFAAARRHHQRFDAASAARAARAGLLEWSGPAYAEVLDATAFAFEAGRLELARAECAEIEAEAQLALGNPRAAGTLLPSIVADHPERERSWVLLALGRYGVGDQVGSLGLLTQARHRLRGSVGVDPGALLEAVEDAIVHHEPWIAQPWPLRGGRVAVE